MKNDELADAILQAAEKIAESMDGVACAIERLAMDGVACAIERLADAIAESKGK